MQTQHQPPNASRYLPNHYTVETAAGILHIGERELFAELRRLGLIEKRSTKPKKPYIEQGLMAVRNSTFRHPGTGQIRYYQRPMVTPAGVVWLHDQGVGNAS